MSEGKKATSPPLKKSLIWETIYKNICPQLRVVCMYQMSTAVVKFCGMPEGQ